MTLDCAWIAPHGSELPCRLSYRHQNLLPDFTDAFEIINQDSLMQLGGQRLEHRRQLREKRPPNERAARRPEMERTRRIAYFWKRSVQSHPCETPFRSISSSDGPILRPFCSRCTQYGSQPSALTPSMSAMSSSEGGYRGSIVVRWLEDRG
ncbi:hypothetical protein E4U51_007730 [Claviceps purpurea]|nr:hypothetical protein E4U51_007730 [Claviceps purpurea]